MQDHGKLGGDSEYCRRLISVIRLVTKRDLASLRAVNDFVRTGGVYGSGLDKKTADYVAGRAFHALSGEISRDVNDSQFGEDAVSAGVMETALWFIKSLGPDMFTAGAFAARVVAQLEALAPGLCFASNGVAILCNAVDQLVAAPRVESQCWERQMLTLLTLLDALLCSWFSETLARFGAADRASSVGLAIVERSCLSACFVLDVCGPHTTEMSFSFLDRFGGLLQYMMMTEFCAATHVHLQLGERLRAVLGLMTSNPMGPLQQWVIRYGLLPVARAEVLARRDPSATPFCKRACCAAKGPGAPDLLTALLHWPGALQHLAAVIETLADARTLGARLVAYLVQESAESRTRLRRSPGGEPLLKALQAARVSAAAAARRQSDGERGAADNSAVLKDDDTAGFSVPDCSRPATDRRSESVAMIDAASSALTGGAGALAEREAAAERAAASLLAEEEAAAKPRQGGAAGGPGKKSKQGKKSGNAARNTGCAACTRCRGCSRCAARAGAAGIACPRL